MTVDMNRVKEILEEYVQSPGFEGDVERRIREYDQTLAETGIDPELRTAYLNEFDWCTLVVGYEDDGSLGSLVGNLKSFFRGTVSGLFGNETALRFLRTHTGTRVAIVNVLSLEDVAWARELLEVILDECRHDLKLLAIASSPDIRQALTDSLFETYPDEKSLVEAFFVKIYGKDAVPPIRL
jgi:hypothetical protein